MHVQQEPAQISSSVVERSGVVGASVSPLQLCLSHPGPHRDSSRGKQLCQHGLLSSGAPCEGVKCLFSFVYRTENLWELLALTMAAVKKKKRKKKSCLFCGGEPLTRKADVQMYL